VAYIHYREHSIVSAAVFDEASGQWKLGARISWQGKHSSRIQFVNDSPEVFFLFRFEDAEKAGVEYSKNWVDNKVNKIDPQSSASRQSTTTESLRDRMDSETHPIALLAVTAQDKRNRKGPCVYERT